jgi:hypothetical protein
MSKTRNDAAKILLEKGWTFEEVESVLIKKSARQSKTRTQNKTNQVKQNKSKND